MTIDTKALRGLINARSISRAKVNLEKSDCSGGSKVIINKVLDALPDLLDAYEERDRLRNELEQVADSIGPMARLLEDNPITAGSVTKALRLIEKSAYKALEPKQ